MTGWKTKAAAAIAIFYGIAGIFLGLHGPDVGVQLVVNGLGLIGIGHKIEKIGASSVNGATRDQ